MLLDCKESYFMINIPKFKKIWRNKLVSILMKSMLNFNHAHGKCIVFTERGFYRIKKKILGLMYFFLYFIWLYVKDFVLQCD